MTDRETPLVRKDYETMQVLLEAIWQDGTQRAHADPLTLAHALITFSIDRLLAFHDAATVQMICERQGQLIGAMYEQAQERVKH